MSTNCLVTRLKGTVNNNFLEKVGHSIIPVDTSVLTSGNVLTLWYTDIRSEGETIDFLDHNGNIIGSKGFNTSSPTSYNVGVTDIPAGTEYIDIPDKYSFVRLIGGVNKFIKELKADDIKFSSELKVLTCNASDLSKVSINDIPAHINEINAYMSEIKDVNTISLSRFDSLATLDLRSVNMNIDVKALAENLFRLGTYSGSKNWRISGSFDDTVIAASTNPVNFNFSNNTVQVSYSSNILGTYNGTSWS